MRISDWSSDVCSSDLKEVEIVTIAPPFAADALAAGEVDGICVGEPWNSVAVGKGVGAIVTVTSHIWQRGVEKVLAMLTERMESERDLVHSVIRALYKDRKSTRLNSSH